MTKNEIVADVISSENNTLHYLLEWFIDHDHLIEDDVDFQISDAIIELLYKYIDNTEKEENNNDQ